MPDLYTLGAARVEDKDGNPCPPVCHITLDVDEDNDIREDLGEVGLCFALGLTSLPAAPDENGKAEGIGIEGVGGFNALCVGGRDSRCTDVVGQLQPAETCLHSTEADATTRAKVFCKPNSASMLVGNDTVFVMNRAKKSAILNVKGAGQLELSEAKGFMVSDSTGTGFTAKDGKIIINAGEISMPGGANIGGDGAMPVALAAGLLTYLSALETLLTALATSLDAKLAPTPGVSVGAVSSFIAAGAAMKAALTAKVTNGK